MSHRGGKAVTEFMQVLANMPDIRRALASANKGTLAAGPSLTCRILLACSDGRKCKEIADGMNASTRTVSTSLFRAQAFFNQHAPTARNADELVRAFFAQPPPRRGRPPVPARVRQAVEVLALLGRGQGQRLTVREIARLAGVSPSLAHKLMRQAEAAAVRPPPPGTGSGDGPSSCAAGGG